MGRELVRRKFRLHEEHQVAPTLNLILSTGREWRAIAFVRWADAVGYQFGWGEMTGAQRRTVEADAALLANDSLETREGAAERLVGRGPAALDVLEDLEGADDEARLRLRNVLTRLREVRAFHARLGLDHDVEFLRALGGPSRDDARRRLDSILPEEFRATPELWRTVAPRFKWDPAVQRFVPR